MSQKPISELRRRMLEDMAVRKFGDATQRNYSRHVAQLAKFLGRSPDAATADDVRRFQVHMTEDGARPSTLNSASSALRFFFGTTLDRPELAWHLWRVHYARPLPRVLSPEEVGRLLEGTCCGSLALRAMAIPAANGELTISCLMGKIGNGELAKACHLPGKLFHVFHRGYAYVQNTPQATL